MEEIREAIERAKASDVIGAEQRLRERSGRQQAPTGLAARPVGRIKEIQLDAAHLESNRIVAHDYKEPSSASFDVLRTQVLQAMDVKEWKFLGITSPTPNCGKTVTSVNLALSIARQPERSVLLVDLDMRKPQVANCLGLRPSDGVLSILDHQTPVSSAILRAHIENTSFFVLPTEAPTIGSSDRIASRAMSTMLENIKSDYQSQFIIFDLPPILGSDDVLAILPQLDCLLMVTAAGVSTRAEIEECAKHLQSVEIIRVVLNKVPFSDSGYYSYY